MLSIVLSGIAAVRIRPHTDYPPAEPEKIEILYELFN